MLKHLRILIVLLAISVCGHAQTRQALKNFAASLEVEKNVNPEAYKETYSGNPCLYEGWQEGTIFLTNGEQVTLDMSYMIYGQLMLVNRGDKITKLTKPKDIDKIKVDDRVLIYYPVHITKGNMKDSYLELLYEGGFSLCKRYKCVVQHPDDQRSPYDEKLKPRFVMKETYFFVEKGEPGELVPRSKADFFKIFGEKETQMKKECKSRKLKLKKEEDLIEIFKYYNSLL